MIASPVDVCFGAHGAADRYGICVVIDRLRTAVPPPYSPATSAERRELET